MKISLLTKVFAATVAAALLVPPAVATASPSYNDGFRGTLLDVVPVQRLDAGGVRSVVGQAQFDTSAARYGVDAYRVRYRTIDVHGRPTTASGLVVVPRGGSGEFVSYAHGTRTGRTDVASVSAENADRPASLLIGSAGFTAVSPDYLGLGEGPGYHPYMDSATEASASLDALRAARTLLQRQGKHVDGRVLATGFSQGGQAAMALGRTLQSGADRGFRLAGLAPISGPLDALGVEMPAALDGRVDPADAAFYLSYWTVAKNRLFPLYRNTSEVFRAPYDSYVESLFDGSKDELQIFPRLAASPQEMFTDSYLKQLRHPTGAALAAVRATDGTCSDWRPRVPVQLFASRVDEQVNFANSVSCQQDLVEHGVQAKLTFLPPVLHLDSGKAGLPLALKWFVGLSGR